MRSAYLYGALVGDVEQQHGEAPGRVLLLELLELGRGTRRAAPGDDAAFAASPQQLPHLHRTDSQRAEAEQASKRNPTIWR